MARTAKIKKNWYKIVAKRQFGGKTLGEIRLAEPRMGIGRKITLNMMNLTNDPKKQGTNITFDIVSQEKDSLGAELSMIQLSPSAIRRMTRRSKSRVDDAFKLETVDHKKVIIKPFILLRGKASKSVLTTVRKLTRSIIATQIKKMDYSAFLDDVLSNNLQKMIKQRMHTTYPIAASEIRVVKLVDDKKPGEKAEVKPADVKPAEPKKEAPKEEKKEDKKEDKKETPAPKKEEKPEEKKE